MKFSLLISNTALSQSSIVAQYWKKNMIKFSQQPVTEPQKIIFPARDFNSEGYKIKSTPAYKFFLNFTTKKKLETLTKRRVNDFNSDVTVVVCRCNEPMHDIDLTPRH